MKVPFLTIVYVVALLICGSLNTITMKIAFTMTGTNSEGHVENFQKPWFITFIMFAAMSLALPFDKDMWRKSRRDARIDMTPGNVAAPLLGANSKMTWGKKVQMVAIPAVFDILATGLCSMGFLYIPASVWQLLRGAEMVFAAILAVVCLKRKLYGHHWLGIGLSALGIILVGMATVGGEDEGTSEPGSVSSVLFGMGLCLLGQIVQAAQVIAEEWLLNDVDLPGLQIVGFEGIWGGLIMLLIAFPLLWAIPGSDMGHMEDEKDTFIMIDSNKSLLYMLIIYLFSCCTYNMAGIAVTGALSAVHRVMLEAFRTSFVWVFGLSVHYFYSPTSPVGEVFTSYSWLEIAGFFVLLGGQVTYGALVKIPGLEYPQHDDVAEMLKSPGSIRNLASPLPPRSPVALEEM